jgi:putative ABC transport system substrate-binding protein
LAFGLFLCSDDFSTSTAPQLVAARLLGKVLRGAQPNDLPVEQPTRFELVITLQAAKAIGHDIPAGIVLRADKVID